MAKKEKETNTIDENVKEEKKSIVIPELEFVCRMCLSLQGKPGARSSECIQKNSKGVLCSNMQCLMDLIISLKTENELHSKYLKAFNNQPYFTKEEMHELFISLFNKENLSEDEFLDYCRSAGFIIV